MAQLKTQPTNQDVEAFIAGIADEQQRLDSKTLCDLMSEVTGQPPRMWGSSIVGFGQYHYKYKSGREGDFAPVGFSPRKANLTVYVLDGTSTRQNLLEKLGPHKTGKSCIYIKRLDDIDVSTLKKIVDNAYKYVMEHVDAMHRAV